MDMSDLSECEPNSSQPVWDLQDTETTSFADVNEELIKRIIKGRNRMTDECGVINKQID